MNTATKTDTVIKSNTRPTLTAKMNPIDWDNLEIVRNYYMENRGLNLKDSSIMKMLLADKVAEIKQNKQ